MWICPFFKYPCQNSTSAPMTNYKNEILFLDTNVGTGILWEHVLHWIWGKLLLCIPMTSSQCACARKWNLTGCNGANMYKVTCQIPQVWTRHYFVLLPSCLYSGTWCEQPLILESFMLVHCTICVRTTLERIRITLMAVRPCVFCL